MNVQFAGFLTLEEQPRLTPLLKRKKKQNKKQPPLYLYEFTFIFNSGSV